jgi:hypothetical protein
MASLVRIRVKSPLFSVVSVYFLNSQIYNLEAFLEIRIVSPTAHISDLKLFNR